MSRRLALVALALVGVLLAPAAALAEGGEFKPVDEFLNEYWASFALGPLTIGVSKLVVYLWLGLAITIVLTLWIVRGGLRTQPGRTQTVVELLYTFSESNIGQATLPKAAFARWFPYVASLFVFIWTLNMISFIPLPLDTHNPLYGPIPGLTLYAATSNLSVTLTLALMTIAISHFEGARANGVWPYLKSWVPPSPPALKPFLIVLEVLSQLLRIISLSVRLFANMLAGHLLIIMCIGFVILLGKLFVAPIAIPIAVVFWIFEWGLVASLQAYIFAMLSGIYIGSAIEPHH
ncbi:MAG: F0F1 ATP synthase subunit A [Actinomycetota bacterium]